LNLHFLHFAIFQKCNSYEIWKNKIYFEFELVVKASKKWVKWHLWWNAKVKRYRHKNLFYFKQASKKIFNMPEGIKIQKKLEVDTFCHFVHRFNVGRKHFNVINFVVCSNNTEDREKQANAIFLISSICFQHSKKKWNRNTERKWTLKRRRKNRKLVCDFNWIDFSSCTFLCKNIYIFYLIEFFLYLWEKRNFNFNLYSNST
jgi:hypothetical protein